MECSCKIVTMGDFSKQPSTKLDDWKIVHGPCHSVSEAQLAQTMKAYNQLESKWFDLTYQNKRLVELLQKALPFTVDNPALRTNIESALSVEME